MKNPNHIPISRFNYFRNYPYIYQIIKGISLSWKEHMPALSICLLSHSKESLKILDDLCKDLLTISGDRSSQYFESYRWMCNEINKEQLFFVRNERYRLTTFKEAFEEIYSNKVYMQKYMEGLLFSQFLWSNHSKSHLKHREFIESIPSQFSYLEIGPGHGLFLASAARNSACNYLEAWDVSEESLSQTNNSLLVLNIKKPVNLLKIDVQSHVHAQDSKKFDVIVISEVLEHLENPHLTLEKLSKLLTSNGKIFINFPINSPAPDHIYLLRSLNEVSSLISKAGFNVISSSQYPASGYDISDAIRMKATISCIVIAETSHS